METGGRRRSENFEDRGRGVGVRGGGIAPRLLSFVMRRFGLPGLLAAPLIGESLCSNWYTVRRGFRGQPLSAFQLLRASVGPP